MSFLGKEFEDKTNPEIEYVKNHHAELIFNSGDTFFF